ncbi:MAG TPA: hypothetical protein VG737_09935 [Cyclobacteriaceae bacterium]|nr:hypothetical protein [Cyclobacteriaceae bacterium]
MTTIRTYDDLLAEKKRLEEMLQIQKALIKYDAATLRDELKPVQNVFSTLSRVASSKTDNPLFRTGLAIVGDVLMRSTFIAGGGWITRLMLPIVARNITKMFFKRPKPIMDVVGRIFHRSNGIPK